MSVFRDALVSDTDDFFDTAYQVIQGRTIPSVEDIPFGNYGKQVELAMLFIDIRESTNIVDAFRLETAARMYQSFLRGVALIALNNDGEVRSFNGDGVLITFYGDSKCNNAARSALQMMEFVKTILKPKMRRYFLRNKKAVDLTLDCGIGIDVGDIFVVRGGVKGGNNNDLVWVGNPTNYAVKLSAQSKKVTTPTTLANVVKQQTQPSTEIYNIHITNRVYSNLRENLKTKLGLLNMKINIWERQPILLRSLLPGSLANTTIYRTNKTLPL